jgi:hypothetical protein
MRRRTYTLPATTKKIKCLGKVINNNTTFTYLGYKFRFDKDCQSIPLEVPLVVAEELLKITRSDCNCHAGKTTQLFEEVVI